MDPKLRRLARDCYRQASWLISVSYKRCLTPTPASSRYKPVAYDSTSSFHSKARYIRSDAPPPSSGALTITANSNSSPQRVESVLGINLFSEGWLQDPNCVGSSVATIGQKSSDLSSWDNWATEPSREYVPRSTYHINARAYSKGEWGQVAKGARTNSKEYVAAHLLCTIH
jgi:hypothetical protein